MPQSATNASVADIAGRQAVLSELTSLAQDYKASVVAAELADNDIPADVFFFRNRSTFRRPVSKDIEHIYWNDPDDVEPQLIFELNREGIYDMLPEAIAHGYSQQRKSDDATKLGNRLRREEKAARDFFSPLENEFHNRSLQLDVIERELYKNNNPQRNREFFHYFFEDSRHLSDRQQLILLHILPLSHKIRGDLQLISLTLTRILNHPVVLSRRWTRMRYVSAASDPPALGEALLGVDAISGTGSTVPVCSYIINIGEIATTDYRHFIAGGKHLNVLSFILPYFLPVHAEYSLTLHCKEDEADLTSADGDSDTFSHLGFNSYI